MFRLNSGLFLAVCLVVIFPLAARAEEKAEKKNDPDPQEKGIWKTRVDVVTRYHFFGYTPSKILETHGDVPFASRDIPSDRADVRARLKIVGRYLHFELTPHTAIPSDGVRVNYGGLEASLVAPLAEWLRVGLYHHSAHNFSDSTYGWGTDLNAVVVDADLSLGDFTLAGKEGAYHLRSLSHWYWKGNGPPYLVTRHTEVVPATIPQLLWRSGLEFDASHPLGRAECNLILLSPELLPSSVSVTCAGMLALDGTFLGALGEHLFAGPFLSYGQNFDRISEFGQFTVYGGLQFDLVFADTISPVR